MILDLKDRIITYPSYGHVNCAVQCLAVWLDIPIKEALGHMPSKKRTSLANCKIGCKTEWLIDALTVAGRRVEHRDSIREPDPDEIPEVCFILGKIGAERSRSYGMSGGSQYHAMLRAGDFVFDPAGAVREWEELLRLWRVCGWISEI